MQNTAVQAHLVTVVKSSESIFVNLFKALVEIQKYPLTPNSTTKRQICGRLIGLGHIT